MIPKQLTLKSRPKWLPRRAKGGVVEEAGSVDELRRPNGVRRLPHFHANQSQ